MRIKLNKVLLTGPLVDPSMGGPDGRPASPTDQKWGMVVAARSTLPRMRRANLETVLKKAQKQQSFNVLRRYAVSNTNVYYAITMLHLAIAIDCHG